MQVHVDISGSHSTCFAREGQTLLEVLQENNIEISAPCGGAGTCGKCHILINDGDGFRSRLACQTLVRDGMNVVIERPTTMNTAESGIAWSCPLDAGLDGFGIAIDLGTTTIAAHLHNLSTGDRLASTSRMNPQAAFGADVISRISACTEGKLESLTSVVQNALASMSDDLCNQAGVLQSNICRATLAGNTVMEHIACGLSPETIGVSPFTPLSLFGDERALPGLPAVRFSRCVAGYVGGDVVAGMVATDISKDGPSLFIDLGTNGEMALYNNDTVYCCATAAGPVFEGAGIFLGLPAVSGAISRVEFTHENLQTQVISGTNPIGICGSGVIDAVAVLLDAGIVDESGRMLGPNEARGPLAHLVGTEHGETVFYLDAERRVYLTQKDVRSVQLAKAAVCAGIYTLLRHANITPEEVNRLYVAGGFGAYVRMQSAARVGLFPPELASRAISIGNASAEGAAAMLLSQEARNQEQRIAQLCSYIELSTSMDFNELFVECMDFENECSA